MPKPPPREPAIPTTHSTDPDAWFGSIVAPGDRYSGSLVLTENFSGSNVTAPVFVWRGLRPGPVVCVTAAVHGDEINGTGAIRHIIRERPFELFCGTLVMVPVVNVIGFEQHSRYLPDRRDLNRSFPGSKTGSFASRLASSFFQQVTTRCNYGIDLHTAAVRRTNFPNVRADMKDTRLAGFARAFGTELIVSGSGPDGSLRAAACAAGCATLILEAGEVWKVEPGYMEYAVRGITNCLRYLGMVEGEPESPPYQLETDATTWVRAKNGGFLEFHVAPGEIVHEGQPIATNTDLTGAALNTIRAPLDGIILGMTTTPSVAPGDPVCHIAFPRSGTINKISGVIDRLHDDSLHERTRDDLATNMVITESDEPDELYGSYERDEPDEDFKHDAADFNGDSGDDADEPGAS